MEIDGRICHIMHCQEAIAATQSKHWWLEHGTLCEMEHHRKYWFVHSRRHCSFYGNMTKHQNCESGKRCHPSNQTQKLLLWKIGGRLAFLTSHRRNGTVPQLQLDTWHPKGRIMDKHNVSWSTFIASCLLPKENWHSQCQMWFHPLTWLDKASSLFFFSSLGWLMFFLQKISIRTSSAPK